MAAGSIIGIIYKSEIGQAVYTNIVLLIHLTNFNSSSFGAFPHHQDVGWFLEETETHEVLCMTRTI